MQVAFDAQQAALEQREQIVEARRREFLPERLPGVARRPQREAVIRRDERPRRHPGDAPLRDAHEISALADFEQERGVHEASAPHEFLVGVHQLGQALDHGFTLHASFTSASTATTPSPCGLTISGLISASAMGSPISASRDSATMASASAETSPAGWPRNPASVLSRCTSPIMACASA